MSIQDELAESLRESLEQEPPNLPRDLFELRDADIVEVLNHLTTPEAAHAVQHFPLALAIRLCDLPELRRRASILEQLESTRAAEILEGLSADERATVLRSMSPHDQHRLVPALSKSVCVEVELLLKYPPETAGGIMTTEFVRLGPSMTVGESLQHIRRVAAEKETIYACYVLEPDTNRLLGAVSLRDLVMADPAALVASVMRKKPVCVSAYDPQRVVAQKISKYNLLAVPVLERDGSVVGFATVDDVIDVMVEEETASALRAGAVEPGALDQPYMTTGFVEMVKKRATWLVILFLGEMLTATAMGHFEDEISKAVVLALFVPLIISSGGNSGSQASTIIIRAMALGEFQLRDWWKIARREVLSGFALGVILGVIGFLRIALWSAFSSIYGPHWILVGVTVALALIGVVSWGTISGSMLPLILRRFGADPATSSAPFVATLVDVTGLVIYFTVALVVLHGTVL
jgi:magnesium transporter